jgi:hypothetical protein
MEPVDQHLGTRLSAAEATAMTRANDGSAR